MRVAITGGTGTLGRALITRLLTIESVDRIVSVSRDEVKAGDLKAQFPDVTLRTYLGDVRDIERLIEAFWGCDTVIHAAALKRVTESVTSTSEMIKTNVMGTMNVIKAAQQAGVARVLFISSDKAVHATNLYGSTKFTAECYAVQANSVTYPRGTKVACTRYGNVWGSRGSVTEVWAAVPQDEPIPLTSARMTRFILTVDQAVEFVLRCLDSMQGGEVFIPLLPGMALMDLALALYPNREARFTGLRPGGEKLHEELVSDEEVNRLYKTDWGSLVVLPSFRTWSAEPYPYKQVRLESYSSDQVFRGEL